MDLWTLSSKAWLDNCPDVDEFEADRRGWGRMFPITDVVLPLMARLHALMWCLNDFWLVNHRCTSSWRMDGWCFRKMKRACLLLFGNTIARAFRMMQITKTYGREWYARWFKENTCRFVATWQMTSVRHLKVSSDGNMFRLLITYNLLHLIPNQVMLIGVWLMQMSWQRTRI